MYGTDTAPRFVRRHRRQVRLPVLLPGCNAVLCADNYFVQRNPRSLYHRRFRDCTLVPAHAGYMGSGMLSAAVCWEVFASPPAAAVLAAIRQAR